MRASEQRRPDEASPRTQGGAAPKTPLPPHRVAVRKSRRSPAQPTPSMKNPRHASGSSTSDPEPRTPPHPSAREGRAYPLWRIIGRCGRSGSSSVPSGVAIADCRIQVPNPTAESKCRIRNHCNTDLSSIQLCHTAARQVNRQQASANTVSGAFVQTKGCPLGSPCAPPKENPPLPSTAGSAPGTYGDSPCNEKNDGEATSSILGHQGVADMRAGRARSPLMIAVLITISRFWFCQPDGTL